MSNIIIPKEVSFEENLALMNDDAEFEVGDDSDAITTAIRCASDIRSKPSPPKISKLFLSGSCVFNCAYCACRCGREKKHAYLHTPSELAAFAVNSAKENGHGVFISSAIYQNADHTQELLAETARIIRHKLGYRGFMHVKVMPGADPELIHRTGMYANRLSVNIEVARSSGYSKIAKQKNKENILTPMKSISDQIRMAAYERDSAFATSQTTQLMAGSTGEDDRTILILSEALYRKYGMKRVYYTAFQYGYEAAGYESENLPKIHTPLWRMARLYQADRLTQLYGFTSDELLPENSPFLFPDLDPKTVWALAHMELYPVELSTADFDTLIRVPGIGITSAEKIITARKYCHITFDVIKKLHISLKRSAFFITCGGKYIGGNALFSENLREILSSPPKQLSFFDSDADTNDNPFLKLDRGYAE